MWIRYVVWNFAKIKKARVQAAGAAASASSTHSVMFILLNTNHYDTKIKKMKKKQNQHDWSIPVHSYARVHIQIYLKLLTQINGEQNKKIKRKHFTDETSNKSTQKQRD